MAFPISQGVFVQGQCRPPEWQPKGDVLFIGPFEKGPVGVPMALHGRDQAQAIFGDGATPGAQVTAKALQQFFEQGGQRALALRLGLGDKTGMRKGQPPLYLMPDMAGAAAEFDPGPDPLLPLDEGWKAAVGAAFGGADLGAILNGLPRGRIEMMAAPALAELEQPEARRAYRRLHEICEKRDIFLLLDPKRGMAIDALEAAWFSTFGLKDSTYAVALAPMLKVARSTARAGGAPAAIAPSGPVAGLLDRVAGDGVWSAPNGLQASLFGVKSEVTIETERQHQPGPVNFLMEQGRGVRFGACGVFTLAGDVAPRLRFLRVLRKTRLTLRHELLRLQAEHDPAGRRSEARLIAEALLMQLWQDGALCGETSAQAFRVTTTEPDDTGAFALCAGLALQAPGRFLWETIQVQG